MQDVLTKKLTKGRIYRLDDTSKYLDFQYNPGEFTDSRGVNWTEIKGAGMSYAIHQYSGGKTRSFDIELFFNDQEKKGSIKKAEDFFEKLHPPARKEGYQFINPTPIIFSFGWMIKVMLIQDYKVKYDYFSPDIKPLMCTITLTLLAVQ